ncbi:MAG: thioredoxin domain-containing protein [Gemmatimonadaceae bacterium]|nr:thioredoxin domain-containing protein [Gemmatimonadaceae bacterium]
MPIHRVNFGAALVAILLLLACSPANSNPRPTDAAASAAAPTKTTAPATDLVVAAADHGRVDGDSTARTWVIIASDFQCPYCKQWHDESYKTFINEYVRSGKVKVAYINFPLGQHQHAVITAEAAMCASAQNKFWQYHDALFNSQKQWTPMPDPRPVLDSIARTVGVDVAEWSKCVDSKRMLPLIMADHDRAESAGVQSTPSFIVGDSILAGALPFADMRPVLDAAIAKSGSAPTH